MVSREIKERAKSEEQQKNKTTTQTHRLFFSFLHQPLSLPSSGYETVPEELKASRVASVFSSVASSYDVMNDLMSGGAHRLWKSALVDAVLPPASSSSTSSSSFSPSPSPLVAAGFDHLDVAGGTGDVAFRVLQRMRELGVSSHNCSVTVCDINAEMLREGERKARAQGLLNDDEEEEKENADGDDDKTSFSSLDRPPSSRRGKNNIPTSKIPLNFVLGDAERLPFADASFDSYTIAFGIRNVTRIPLALADARRVLKRGGAFACLEFSAVRAPLLKEVYDAYSFEVIPRMGRAVAGDEASYRYLVESIRRFPGRRRFAAMMREAGFKGVRFESFAAGAVALHVGFKL